MGKITAKTLIAEGHIVYGAARRVANMQDFVKSGGYAIGMDITDEAQVQSAVDRILSEQGHIDVLVNNAGYAVYGAVEQVSFDDARRQFVWVSVTNPNKFSHICESAALASSSTLRRLAARSTHH